MSPRHGRKPLDRIKRRSVIYLKRLPIPTFPLTHTPPLLQGIQSSPRCVVVRVRRVRSFRAINHKYTHIDTPSQYSADRGLVLRRLFRWDEEPPEGYDESESCGNAECPCRPYLVEDGPAGESSEDEEKDRHDFMIACDDEAAEVEELGLGHEFAPRRGQDD